MEFTKIISSPVFPCSAPDIGLTVENAGPITLKVSTASNTWEVQLSPVQSETGSSSGKKGQVTIRLRDILASIAKAPDLADNNLTSRTPFLSVNLSASNAAGEQDSMDIQVAYGNLTGKNPEDFLGHWLTTREQISRTYSWARERLSLLFGPKLLRWTGSVTLSVKCTAYLMSGQKRTVELASTSSEEDVYYSVDCSYNTISALIEDIGLAAWDLTYTLNGIDAYGEPAVLESYPQRFILAYQDSRVKEFLFTNRFGLEDRIFAEGISKKKIDGSSSTFANGGKLAELRNNAETVYEAFSGQLSDKRAVFHWHDFLSSANRMVVDADDTAIGIVVDSYDSETEDYSVGGISFNYRLSVKNSAFPDELYGSLGDYDPHEQFGALWVNQNPQAVTPEEEDLFFLRHRLSEFQALDVSDTLLLLVQCPLTDAWGSVSFENLKIWLKSVFDKEKKDIRLNALSDYETDDGKVIIPADLPNGSIPVWNSAAGAYRPVRASDLGQFGGFDKEYLWQILGTDSGEQINISHLPIKEIATALIKAGYKLTDSFHEYFGIDANKDIYVKDNRGLWSDSFLSSKGSDPEAGSGSGGIDVDTLWQILGTATSEQINVSHIPSLSIDKISGLQTALNSKLEAITKEMVETVLTGTITSHNHSGQYAPLSGGLIPSQYLPSFVDDVLEYPSKSAFPASGESGKIYVAADTNLTYRWSGTAYVEISPSLALGHTSSTAYPGDEGLANAQAIGTLQGYFANGAAKKVANELTIKGNGTTLGTYDGSSPVSVNLTYSNVGAAAATHTHTRSQITDFPTSWEWSAITGKPTTLAGYGIEDGVNSVTANGNLSGSISGHKLTVGVKNGYAIPTNSQIALWDKICALFEVDTDGNVYVANNKGFYSNSFLSARGSDPDAGSSGSAGINEPELWEILATAGTEKIDASHIPSLSSLSGQLTNAQLAFDSIAVAGVTVALGGSVTTKQIADALTAAGYKLTDTTYTLASFGITATAAELNKLDGLATTATELGYVHGVTSNIQTQLDARMLAGSGKGYNIAYSKKINFNGTEYYFLGTTATAMPAFYAPASAGTSGQWLRATGAAPVWSNDGEGSGLDADMLDGYHISSLAVDMGTMWGGNDLNKFTKSGWFAIANNPINSPVSYGNGLSLGGLQIAVEQNGKMFFRSSWSGYKDWTQAIDVNNYKDYTVTKTGDGASGTWNIGINGNAGSANMLRTTNLSNEDLNDIRTEGMLYYAGGSNSVTNKPSDVDAFGMMSIRTASGWFGQLLMSSNLATGLYWRTQLTYTDDGWRKVLDSKNYTEYTVTKTGGGASGTWPISISGNSDTVDNWHGVGTSGQVLKKSGYTYSSEPNLEHYWAKLAEFTWGGSYSYKSITLYLHHPLTAPVCGILRIRFRWDSTSSLSVVCEILAGNLNTSNIRLYYDQPASNNKLELWYNGNAQYRGISAVVLSETNGIDGPETDVATLFRNDFKTVQELPDKDYVEAQYVSLYNNSATATKLSTACTLWGQSFDGTQNVGGNMVGMTGFCASQNPDDTWSDGTNDHYWSGYDFHNNTGVFSSVISNYHGLCLRTQLGYISMQGNGNVGIGTTTPSYRLDVNGNGRFSSELALSSTLTAYGLATFNGGIKVNSIINEKYYHRLDLGCYGSNQWDFYEYGGTFNFYKNTTGTQEGAIKIFSILGDKVGVGNVTPTYNLHVIGTGYFSSSLSLGSTLTAQGLATLNGGVKTNTITLVNGSKTANISLDADGNIHATAGLYSDSFLSSKGKDSEAGSAGEASYLPEISFSDLPQGQAVTLAQLAAAGFTETVIADMQSGKVTHVKAKYSTGNIEIWPVQGAGVNFFIVGYSSTSGYFDMEEWYEVSRLDKDGQIVAELFER